MYGAILLNPGRTNDGTDDDPFEDFAVPSFIGPLLSRTGLREIKYSRLDGVKLHIAEGGVESGSLRRGTHDANAHLSSRHKIPLTYRHEFLPVQGTQGLNRIFFTHCAPPDISRVREIRHRRPIREVAGKDYARMAVSVEEFRSALHPIFSVE